jgi:glutamine synthetase type III
MKIELDKIFGENVFSKHVLKKYIGSRSYNKFIKAIDLETKEILDSDLANEIANAMKD